MFGPTFRYYSAALKICSSLVEWKVLMRNASKKSTHNSKILPRLVYLHNPWAYIQTQWQFLKLRLLWDRDFLHDEFIRGAKQSAVVVTEIVRGQDDTEIGSLTTPRGFRQITRDMILSRNDARLKLIHFRTEDIHRAIPMKVNLFEGGGRKNCYVDMVFVLMRNSKDFSDSKTMQVVETTLRQMDQETSYAARLANVPHRILFAEIHMRFYRDYAPYILDNWSVAFYKIISFDILNYNPK